MPFAGRQWRPAEDSAGPGPSARRGGRPSRRTRGRPVKRRRFRGRLSVVLDRPVRMTGGGGPVAELLDGPVRSRQGPGRGRPEFRRCGRRRPPGVVAERRSLRRPSGGRPVDGPRPFGGVVLLAAGPRRGLAFARRPEPELVGPVLDHAQLARVVHVPVLARHHARPRLRLDLERAVRSFEPVRVRSVRVVSAKRNVIGF